MQDISLRDVVLAVAVFVVLCTNFIDRQMLNLVFESLPRFW